MRLKTTDMGEKTLAQKIQTSYAAQIDNGATPMVMEMLAKLYSEPLSAAIREYVSNAVDANVEAGANKPVQLTLPEHDNDGTLQVQDYGKGLDYLGIVSVFANFGTSTKRDSDTLIGGFGIGSKSGLAVSNAINVVSICNGYLNEFVLERTSEGIFTRFIRENEETQQESGTCVTVNVNRGYYGDETTIVEEMIPTICGWSKNDVYVTNSSVNADTDKDNFFLNEKCNNYRIPDTWIELPHGYITSKPHFAYKCSILVGNVAYAQSEYRDFNGNPNSRDLGARYALKMDIKDVKVTYSREQIDWQSNKETEDNIREATKLFKEEISNFVHDLVEAATDNVDLIKKCINLGLNPNNIFYKDVNKPADNDVDLTTRKIIENSYLYKYINRGNKIMSYGRPNQGYDGIDIVVTIDKDAYDNTSEKVIEKVLTHTILQAHIDEMQDTLNQFVVNDVKISDRATTNSYSNIPSYILIATEEAQTKLPYSWGKPNIDFAILHDAYKEYQRQQRAAINATRRVNKKDPMLDKVAWFNANGAHCVLKDSLQDIKKLTFDDIILLDSKTKYSPDNARVLERQLKMITAETQKEIPVIMWCNSKQRIKFALKNIDNTRFVTDDEIEAQYNKVVDKYKDCLDVDIQFLFDGLSSIITDTQTISSTNIKEKFGIDPDFSRKVPQVLQPYYFSGTCVSYDDKKKFVESLGDNAKLLVLIMNQYDYTFEDKHINDLLDKLTPKFKPTVDKLNKIYADWL